MKQISIKKDSVPTERHLNTLLLSTQILFLRNKTLKIFNDKTSI